MMATAPPALRKRNVRWKSAAEKAEQTGHNEPPPAVLTSFSYVSILCTKSMLNNTHNAPLTGCDVCVTAEVACVA